MIRSKGQNVSALSEEARETVRSLIQKMLIKCAERNDNITQMFLLTHDRAYYNDSADSLCSYKDIVNKYRLIKNTDRTSIIKDI